MEPKVPESLGGSLLVPNVQELAKGVTGSVPHRYILPDQHRPIISKSASLPQIPIIDMQKLLLGESMDSERDRLHSACQEWGFFQLVNHGVSSSLIERVKSDIQDLFNLPLDEKKRFWQLPGDLEGFGQGFVISEEQILDWGDMFYIVTQPTVLRKPHIFPKLPASFRETIEAYSSDLEKVAKTLLGLMARTLEMDNEEMTELFKDGYQGMRMNYYPSCPQPELVIGLTPHSDVVALTLLLQINEMEGLQIRKQGNWISVKPLPNALVVNIGDALEILSNGAYRSIEHRATVNSMKERLSVATFYSPNIDGEVGPAHSLINPKNPALFQRVGMKEYIKGYFAQKLQGKSYIDTLRIENGEQNNA